MNKLFQLIFFILVLCLILLPSKAHAQELNVSSVPQATVTATVSAKMNKSISSLINILNSMILRLEKLSQRIATRLNKIYAANVNSTDTDKITRLTTQQKNLATQVKQLKTDLTQLDLQVQSATGTGISKKDYFLFRSQTMILIGNIKDVYILESDLVSQMKKIATVTATPVAKTIPLQ